MEYLTEGGWPFILLISCVLLLDLQPVKSKIENLGSTPVNSAEMKQFMEKFGHLRVNEKNYDKVYNLHRNSFYTAVKAVIGQLGIHLYRRLPKYERRRLSACLDRIEDRRELITAARCVTESRRRFLDAVAEESEEAFVFATHFEKSNVNASKAMEVNRPERNKEGTWIGNFRLHASQIQYNDLKPNHTYSKMYRNKNYISKINAPQKSSTFHRTLIKINRHYSEPIRLNNTQLYLMRRRKVKFLLKSSDRLRKYRMRRAKRFIGNIQTRTSATQLMMRTRGNRTLVEKISNLITQFVGPKNFDNIERQTKEPSLRPSTTGTGTYEWPTVYESLRGASDTIKNWKKLPGSKVYDKRMYDIVLERDEPSLTLGERRSPMGLLHAGMDIINRLTNQSRTGEVSTGGDVDRTSGKHIRALSPRFMPLMPDKSPAADGGFLSPTVMSFYDDDKAIASLPKVGHFEHLMRANDQSTLMSMLMDVTGSTRQANMALDLLKDLNFMPSEAKNSLTDASERYASSFKKLEESFDSIQQRTLDSLGFTFMRKPQMEKLLRDQGAKSNEIDLSFYDYYDSCTPKEMEMSLWKTIERIADNDTSVLLNSLSFLVKPLSADELARLRHYRRRRRQITWLTILQPIVLGPYILAPTYGLNVLGPLILSPFVLSPLILNPSVLAPFVLSPGVLDPFILSPYIFGPFILGPFVLTPFILTPYAISPNVINPYVLSPMILSPNLLSPDILSPMTLGGGVLSPTALSPAVFTETFLMVSVLSPTFLS